jgi:flagellar FliJ protein
MKRHLFTLERVLHYRRETEKLRKQECALARREYEVAEERLRREEESLERLNLEFMKRQIDGIGAVELQLYADFFSRKKMDILQQREMVTVLDRKLEEKNESLVAAATDKKIMEELKKKKLAAHEKSLAVKEQAFLDEIALQQRDLSI